MKRTAKVSVYTRWNKEIPILLLNGDDDPVGDFGKGVRRVYRQLKKAGILYVQWETIRYSRHDLFHEEKSGAAGRVRHCICDWIL
jgi:alpha-beta hydrolase superfamily lysophospholipase